MHNEPAGLPELIFRRNSNRCTFAADNLSESGNDEPQASPSPRAHKLLKSIKFKTISNFIPKSSRTEADEWLFKGNISEIKDDDEEDASDEEEAEAQEHVS